MKAKLVLQDWTEFIGESFWYEENTTWEVIFNTWMVWYPELLTDPSYKGQILIAIWQIKKAIEKNKKLKKDIRLVSK